MTKHKSAARIVTIAALVCGLTLVPAALAGSKHHDPAIVFNPSTVSAGQQYTVSMSGLAPNTWVTVGAYFAYPTLTEWCSHDTDSAGNWSCTYTADESGDVLHQAYVFLKNGTKQLVGSGTLTISP